MDDSAQRKTDEIPEILTQYTDQSISTIHHSLRASRRRLVIGLLGHRTIIINRVHPNTKDVTISEPEKEFTVPVRQLAKEIVAIEEDIPVERATGEPYHNIYTALIQTHLPELDDVGAIAYDCDRKTVAPAQNLIVLAMITAITSPVTQMLFQDAVAEIYSAGGTGIEDSIDN
jgi:hypothetical protein